MKTAIAKRMIPFQHLVPRNNWSDTVCYFSLCYTLTSSFEHRNVLLFPHDNPPHSLHPSLIYDLLYAFGSQGRTLKIPVSSHTPRLPCRLIHSSAKHGMLAWLNVLTSAGHTQHAAGFVKTGKTGDGVPVPWSQPQRKSLFIATRWSKGENSWPRMNPFATTCSHFWRSALHSLVLSILTHPMND